ncbi:MAG: radical SAM protein [Acidobacteria bacterium]|nr:radical SAM protein [Acidobacteriota bacterium]
MPTAETSHPPRGLLGFPRRIQVQTINRCNFACPMCPYPGVTAKQPLLRLDDDLFRRLVEEVREANRKVKLCLMLQNEPLLDRRFLNFLDYAHRADDAVSSISAVTNGSMLTAQLLDALMKYERFHLTISVNSTDKARYRMVHGCDLWERLYALLAGWQGRREGVRVSFVLDADSIEDGRAFQSYWRRLGYATRFVPIFARVDTLPVNAPLHSIDYDYGHCHYPVDTLTVLSDGSVILCCNDWLHNHDFGNLHHSTISKVWNCPEMLRLRRAAIEGTLRQYQLCRGCDYPIRSSQRMLLEALISGPPAGTYELPTSAHRSSIRTSAEGEPLPVVVWEINEAGTVVALVCRPAFELPARVWLEFRIGYFGTFDFGSLEPVWCPGTALRIQNEADLGEIVPIRIDLDRGAEQFQFFSWYCADWSVIEKKTWGFGSGEAQ